MLQGSDHLFDRQPCDAVPHHWASRSRTLLWSTGVAALAWLKRPFAVVVWYEPRAEDIVAYEYKARRWCDSTERELINDIATWPHRR
jgi:hypothetical protein